MTFSASGWEGDETVSAAGSIDPADQTPGGPLAFALWPVPHALWNTASALLLRRVLRAHPGLFERLSETGTAIFLIDPKDLPVQFILDANPAAPGLRVSKDRSPGLADATIRGKLGDLLTLMQGDTDGDALFFSRALEIEGDTEAVLALRNAIDDAEIDIVELIAAAFGPFKAPAARATRTGLGLINRMQRDLDGLRGRMLSPLTSRLDQHQSRLDALEQSLSEAEANTPMGKPNRSRRRT